MIEGWGILLADFWGFLVASYSRRRLAEHPSCVTEGTHLLFLHETAYLHARAVSKFSVVVVFAYYEFHPGPQTAGLRGTLPRESTRNQQEVCPMSENILSSKNLAAGNKLAAVPRC